ncbi:probable linoleate 9S-lipoxygenase 5 isoform X2 [Jatropha curcas]|uniref:probable linoleate 9S-lipoxygenase 5 isoform X2 n=1 Tax=Jatropha curcas TaxID=180498 RepID=UPI0009D67B93|nr:probable linoleate 9S-lipoxygenase 5 isoform X2 [Jatropha curcas]
MSSHNVVQVVTEENGNKKMKCEVGECKKIKGNVILKKKKTVLLGINDPQASLHDFFDGLRGRRVSLQLISAVNGDPEDGHRGKLGHPVYLEKWNTSDSIKASKRNFQITFDWEEDIGIPGAFTVRNNHHTEFYLESLTLEDVPGHGSIHFVCNSWIYPAENHEKDRVFFPNKAYIPQKTPTPLHKYREEELENLRGSGKGELQEADRVYDYAYYNDLGDPDKDPKYARPTLGGSTEHPYPRRVRTGREPMKTDPDCESRLPPHKSLSIYVPRDEQFGHSKKKEFIVNSLKSLAQIIGPGLEAVFGGEFDNHNNMLSLFEGGIKVPDDPLHDVVANNNPLKIFKAIFRSDEGSVFKFPVPHVIKEDKSAWMSDEEFAREMLAGLNPVNIRRLEEFPPRSKLNPEQYGNQNSSIKKENIEHNLSGMSIYEAIKKNKLFILDYHDALMPHLRQINSSSSKIYASRTFLFLKEDGTLKPLAIELSLPHCEGYQFGAVSNVYTPAEHGIEGSIWQLAKAYVSVNDSGFHQLISHWLNTHAVIEPFIIATNRQLSVLHPVHKLLHPHFRDTLFINALARQVLISAGGMLESTVFPGEYAMQMSSAVYKDWIFTDQALPKDLKKRGMAVEDENSPYGLRLVIEDYPYAVDGLEIWSAIKKWVKGYCSFYYESNEMVQNDTELQSWWKELQEEGHGDKNGEPWWSRMQTCEELMETCSIIIWIASALHAAVNFGQYPFAGYLPNRPTISRRWMPEKGSAEYKELELNPEVVFFQTITAKPQALLGIALIEILSRHSSDEVYLDQRTPGWTSDKEPLQEFKKFQDTLKEIGERILERNGDRKLKNRFGPVNMPYTLLFPTSEEGLTCQGIPNSISI